MVAPSDTLREALRGYIAAVGEPFVWGPIHRSTIVGRGALYLLMSSPEYQLQ